MNVIVTADDFGASREINDLTAELISERLINRASIIANGPVAKEAVATAKSLAHGEFGIHLNLTEFPTLTGHAELRALFDAEGQFQSRAFDIHSRRRAFRKAVFEEWCAQASKLLGWGLPIEYIDSHHFIHTRPWLFAVIKRLQWRFGIRSVRSSVNLYGAHHVPTMRAMILKRIWSLAMTADSTKTTRYVAGLTDFYDVLHAGEVHHWATSTRNATLELIVHPGNHADVDYQTEIDILRSGWLKDLSRSHGYVQIQPHRRARPEA